MHLHDIPGVVVGVVPWSIITMSHEGDPEEPLAVRDDWLLLTHTSWTVRLLVIKIKKL